MKKLISLLVVLTIAVQFADAQNKILTGVVMSADKNKPLVGANVTIKGTTQSTITDIDGKFQINVSGNAEALVVSYIGMKSKEVTIDLMTDFIIKLESNESKMGFNGDLNYSIYYLWRGQNKCDNPFQLNLNAYAYGLWFKAQGVSGNKKYTEINLEAGYSYSLVSFSISDYYWNRYDDFLCSYAFKDNNMDDVNLGKGAYDYVSNYKDGHRWEASLSFDFSKLVNYLGISVSVNSMFYNSPSWYGKFDLANAWFFALDYNLKYQNFCINAGVGACYDKTDAFLYLYTDDNGSESFFDKKDVDMLRDNIQNENFSDVKTSDFQKTLVNDIKCVSQRVYGNENNFEFIDVHFCMDYKYHFTKRFGVDLNAMLMYNPCADKPYISAGAGILF